ncbi:hypothetical protein Mapa_008028 [Marchantia paleacea]|nr:hypothetical protein Mapa_008028 [Marchantia paleacea]
MNGPEGMGDHLSLDVDRLLAGSAVNSSQDGGSSTRSASSAAPVEHSISINCSDGLKASALPTQDGFGYSPVPTSDALAGINGDGFSDDASTAGAGEIAECRICQEEDDVKNLETPCACSGSVKYAHRKCVQRWCNEKGDTICEICRMSYKSGYDAPPRPHHSDGIPIELSGEWGITGSHPLDHLRDPRLLAMAAAERHLLDAEYDEYAAANASGAACCRSAALILMALLLLRHALLMAAAGTDEDSSTFFTLFFLRAAGFLLPCYIMARAMNILQRRRQRQEAAMAAAEVAIILQAGQARAMHFAVAPGPSPAHELP